LNVAASRESAAFTDVQQRSSASPDAELYIRCLLMCPCSLTVDYSSLMHALESYSMAKTSLEHISQCPCVSCVRCSGANINCASMHLQLHQHLARCSHRQRHSLARPVASATLSHAHPVLAQRAFLPSTCSKGKILCALNLCAAGRCALCS
jgi:hypothetical protein